MSRHRLGKVTGAVDVPRGSDVIHRIHVAAEWLEEGALIEFELPRNLKCAACEGGGCDACGRSGAVSVRGRKELAELVQVTLPKRDESSLESTASGRTLVIRIPERGGIADSPALPRGLLLLSVVPADAADPEVRRIERPAPPPVITEEEALAEQAAADEAPAAAPPPSAPLAESRALLWVGVVLVLWLLFLAWLRLSGRG
ncbi:MAG: hypothetical protein IT377_22475 [Polyangiaceae bacterium]|nr:hypothetical protein [Polyangiaceae bacterium]